MLNIRNNAALEPIIVNAIPKIQLQNGNKMEQCWCSIQHFRRDAGSQRHFHWCSLISSHFSEFNNIHVCQLCSTCMLNNNPLSAIVTNLPSNEMTSNWTTLILRYQHTHCKICVQSAATILIRLSTAAAQIITTTNLTSGQAGSSYTN